MNNKFTTVVFATLVAGTNFAMAATMNGSYISVKGGLSIIQNQEDEKSTRKELLKYKKMYNVGAAVGQKIGTLRTELEGNYMHAKVDNTAITQPSGSVTRYEDNSKAGSLITVILNGYYDIPLDPNIEPYIGVGIGWGHFQSNYVANAVSTNKSSNAVVFQGLLGAQYHVNQAMSVLLEYKFLGTTEVTFKTLGADDYKHVILAHSFNLGFKFIVA